MFQYLGNVVELSPSESMGSEAFWCVESLLVKIVLEQLPLYKCLQTTERERVYSTITDIYQQLFSVCVQQLVQDFRQR